MTMLKFDGNSARRTERTYASPDVEAQRKYVMSLLAPQPGEHVLDVGSGPGYLLALIAEAVGSTGAAYGLEQSSAMNELAAGRTSHMPWAHIDEGNTHPRLPRILPGLMRRAGFEITGRHVYVMFNPETTADSFSTRMMDTMANFVVGRQGLTEADAKAWLTDLRARSDEGDYLYSMNRYVFLATAA